MNRLQRRAAQARARAGEVCTCEVPHFGSIGAWQEAMHRRRQESAKAAARNATWMDAVERNTEYPDTFHSPPPCRAAAFRDNRFRTADIEAVLVSEAPPGQPSGWHADVLLARELPPVGDTLGTKVADPCRTRDDAEREALVMLARVVAMAPTDLRCDA